MLDAKFYTTIDISVSEDRIATLTLDGPDKRNAVTDRMHSELSTIFAQADDDPGIRAIVLTGAGNAFSTGGDTSPDRPYESTSGRTPIEEARHIVEDILAMSTPLIAAVNGHAIGLGAVLATLADVSFMATSAKIGDPHVLAALPAGNGAAALWPLLVGANRAKYLLMTGEIIGAAEAERFGLVTRMVPDGEALPAAHALAERLVALAPQAVEGTKRSVNRLLLMASNAVLPFSLALEESAMAHDDFRAALRGLEN